MRADLGRMRALGGLIVFIWLANREQIEAAIERLR